MSIEQNLSTATIAPEADSPPTRRRDYRWLLSFGTLVALLALIEACIRGFDIPSYIFPAPSEIFKSLYAGFAAPLTSKSAYYTHILTTVSEAMGSFVCGSILGIALGGLIAEFPLLRRLALPYVIGLQSVPKVALAPLFVVWFGLGISSKIVLGILLTFFPLMVNTVAGFASVEKDRLELMQSLKAGSWKTFRYVKLPSALPFIFAGLEMAAAYSVLGAVVGEFVGGNSGLGVLMLNRNASLDIAGSMAALVLLALLGVALQKLVTMARNRLLFWAPSKDVLRNAEPEPD
jgi:NitT/TauT family transport system permease protein